MVGGAPGDLEIGYLQVVFLCEFTCAVLLLSVVLFHIVQFFKIAHACNACVCFDISLRGESL